MNSILFAITNKTSCFIPISLLTTEHSWYLGTAIIREKSVFFGYWDKESRVDDPNNIRALPAECRVSSSALVYKDEISSAVYGFCAIFF